MTSEFLHVAERALEYSRKPMTAKQISDWGISRRLFSDKQSGLTPHMTMRARLSVDIRRKGDASIFVRTDPGKYYLRRLLEDPKAIYHAKPFTPPKSQERVLTFASTELDKYGRIQGISHSCRKYKKLLSNKSCNHIDRWLAEDDETRKQVLSYILVTRKGQVLCFKRGSYNRVADFLRGAQCIGFGGHVAEADLNLMSIHDMGLEESAIRELAEEIKLPADDLKRLQNRQGLELVGVLNDDSSHVGRKHFAFIFKYEVGLSSEWSRPLRGEKSINQLRWLSPTNAPVAMEDFEYWSQLCLREYFPELIKQQPSYKIGRRTPLRPPHLLCVIGMIGSGKSEATRFLKDKFGYKEVNTGRVVAEILNIPPVPLSSREMFQEKAWQFIKTPSGPRELALAIYQQVVNLECERVLVDGIRQKSTLDALRAVAKSSKIGVLYVHTPADLAYSFYRQRDEKDIDVLSFFGLREADVEKEVEELIAESDAVLYNWNGREKYRQAITSLFSDIDDKQ